MDVKSQNFVIENIDRADLRGLAEACHFYNQLAEKILGQSGCLWLGSYKFKHSGGIEDDVWDQFTNKVEDAVTRYDWTKFKTECRLIEHKEEQND